MVNGFDPSGASVAQASAGTWASSTPAGETWLVNRAGVRTADIASTLEVGSVVGLPPGGTGDYRFMDGKASYYLPTPTSISAGVPCSVELGGFVNTSVAGSYSSLIETWNQAATPAVVDSAETGTLEIGASSATSEVHGTVDPTLSFSVLGRSSACNGQSSVNFHGGSSPSAVRLENLDSTQVSGGAQDLSVSSNAGNGFTVFVRTPGITPNTLRDGAGNSIADVSGTHVSPGAPPTAGTPVFWLHEFRRADTIRKQHLGAAHQRRRAGADRSGRARRKDALCWIPSGRFFVNAGR